VTVAPTHHLPTAEPAVAGYDDFHFRPDLPKALHQQLENVIRITKKFLPLLDLLHDHATARDELGNRSILHSCLILSLCIHGVISITSSPVKVE